MAENEEVVDLVKARLDSMKLQLSGLKGSKNEIIMELAEVDRQIDSYSQRITGLESWLTERGIDPDGSTD